MLPGSTPAAARSGRLQASQSCIHDRVLPKLQETGGIKLDTIGHIKGRSPWTSKPSTSPRAVRRAPCAAPRPPRARVVCASRMHRACVVRASCVHRACIVHACMCAHMRACARTCVHAAATAACAAQKSGWGTSPRKNLEIHIDVSHSRQPLVKGERLVRYEVNTVIIQPLRSKSITCSR